jgi:hypothetical protein
VSKQAMEMILPEWLTTKKLAQPMPADALPADANPWQTKYIYALVDPETEEIRYIGKSIRPSERLANHINEPQSNCHRSHWLHSLKAKGLKPILLIIEELSGNWPWQEAERYWIAFGHAQGWPLTNNTSGGDGVPDLPAATREKMRKVWLGRKHTPETLIKLSKASRGRRHSAESKAARSAMFKGREITWTAELSLAVRKFDDVAVADIKARLVAGALVKDLALEYGVHRTTISKIKTGRYAKDAAINKARKEKAAAQSDMFSNAEASA